jgi:hypothetical protein
MRDGFYVVQIFGKRDVEILAARHVSDLYLWLERHRGPAI